MNVDETVLEFSVWSRGRPLSVVRRRLVLGREVLKGGKTQTLRQGACQTLT